MKKFILTLFFQPPRHIYKIFILNVLGLQIFRILLIYLKNFLIKKLIYKYENINSETNDLEKNGFIIIENFLSDNDFTYIKNCFETLKNQNQFKKENYGNADVLIGPIGSDNKILDKFSRSNLSQHVSNIIYKKVKELPEPVFQEINLKSNMQDTDDVNSEFHVDKHYPCCKAFYYVNDNSIENGSFEYISKSHLLTFNRLKFEYFYSIFSSTNYFDKYLTNFDFVKKNNRITFSDEKFEKCFGKIKICSAPKNSLVICNNMGFHKRGKILDNSLKRTHLRFVFYDMQLSTFTLKLKQFLKNFNNKIS